MNRRLTSALAAVTIALTGLAGLAATSAAADVAPLAIDLAGMWRFQPGDDLAWAAADFDDSDWAEVAAPASYAETAQDDPAWAWYRLAIDVPASAKGMPLALDLGPIDDTDETFFNGQMIGKTGTFPPEYSSHWEYPRVYAVPSDIVRWGETNIIAVRVHNGGNAGWDGAGGIFRGPLGLNARRHQASLDLDILPLPTTSAATDFVIASLNAQAMAVAAGDIPSYLATLADEFFHDGHDKTRRQTTLEDWMSRGEGLVLTDVDLQVSVLADGTIVADVIRSWTANNGSDLGRLALADWEVLHFDPSNGQEVGNHSRYYQDGLWSEVEDHWTDFQVFLPEEYQARPSIEMPVVYLLHGANGGPREWEWRYAMPYDRLHDRYDAMFATEGFDPMIVVSVDAGRAGVYDGTWSEMFATEIVPTIDGSLRTIEDRSGRGLTGFSMGGAGVYINGFGHDDLFGSIASHAAFAPTFALQTMAEQSPDWLSSFAFYMDSGADDSFRGGEFVRAMSAELTAKFVPHEASVPPGGHDAFFVAPALERSFCSHAHAFRGEPFSACAVVPEPETAAADPAPVPTPEQQPNESPVSDPAADSLPATGGGLTFLGLLTVGSAALARRRQRTA
ncbi:MAG: enterochelin esterase-like enzyme [Glaciecola sp.]|jgi:enterochelin esterase-like enzyme